MALDPSIALGVKPLEVANPLNQFAQVAQLQHYQQQNALAQRTMEQEDALNRAYAASLGDTGEIDPNMLRKNVIGANLGSKLPAVEKSLLDTRKLKAEVAKNEFENKKAQFDQSVTDILRFDNYDQIIGALDRKVKAGELSTEQAQQLASSVPQDPRMIPAWQIKTARGILSAKDQLEQQFTSQDFGGGTRVISTPKYGGGPAQVVQGSQISKTMTPGEIATEKRERDRIANAENPNVVAKQVVGEDGTVTNFNKFGQVISTVKGAGKQSATYAKTEAQRKTLGNDLSVAISELSEITKDGGLIDQSTGSYIGKGVDLGYRAVGKATPGDIAAGKLAPIADLVLKMVPRFEGPQSDKDTASYKQAAGQLSDSSLPTEIRKEAGKEILRLMKNRKNQFITSDMASGNTAMPAGVAPPEGFVPD